MTDHGFQMQQLQLSGGWLVTRPVDPSGARDADLWLSMLQTVVTHREALPGYTVLKYSQTVEVFRATPTIGDRSIDLIGKRSRPDGLLNRLAYRLGYTRQQRNFRQAIALLQIGINTAKPLALLEQRSSKRQAWLITEFVPDLVDLDQIALRLLPGSPPSQTRRIKNVLIDVVVGLFDALERSRLTHRDLKASNILLKHWDGDVQPVSAWLVDLDGLYQRNPWRRSTRRQPLIRLAASLLSYAAITRTDYARFLRRYLTRRECSADDWKAHYCDLARRASDYVRRSRRRKADKLDGYAGD